MNKRIVYISHLIPLNHVSYQSKSDAKYINSCAGANTGNYVFHNAIQSIFHPILCRPHEYDVCYEANADYYITCDLIWICENTLLPPHIFTWLHHLKKAQKVMIPLSVGLQSNYFKNDFHLHPETLWALHEISEMVTIPCRGGYTAEILEKNGIKNTTILGCPSIYTPMDPSFHVTKPQKLAEDARLSVNITPFDHARAPLKRFQNFYKYVMCNDLQIIGQADKEIESAIQLMESLGLCKDVIEMNLSEKYRYFFNYKDWANAMKEIDFSFGTRFHGNIMAVLDGKPALFLKTDSRVDEMCRFLNLPAVESLVLGERLNVDILYELADYTEFNKNYSGLLNKFVNYFTNLGIPLFNPDLSPYTV